MDGEVSETDGGRDNLPREFHEALEYAVREELDFLERSVERLRARSAESLAVCASDVAAWSLSRDLCDRLIWSCRQLRCFPGRRAHCRDSGSFTATAGGAISLAKSILLRLQAAA